MSDTHDHGLRHDLDPLLAARTPRFPGCYSGRMPHIHFEIYRSTPAATSYAYSASATNFARMSFASDLVFSDGLTPELDGVTGSVSEGYVTALTVGIAA